MKKYSTSERLKQIMNERGLKQIDIINLAQPFCKKHKVKLGRNDISQYISGKVEPRQTKLYILGLALNVNEAWLMGYDVGSKRTDHTPQITNDYTTFPVIGEIAAGYDHIAAEEWSGDIIDIPNSYLKGHTKDEFFVLRVKGDSMYPMYQDGDKVLILKQNTIENGQVGAVLYDNELATLKKIEYNQGTYLILTPINPMYKPETIKGERLNTCKIIGVPKLLIRDLEEK